MQQILEEEKPAGWELVEKLDDRRIRLKRKKSCKNNDQNLKINPYRTVIYPKADRWAIYFLIAFFALLLFAPLLLLFL